MSESEPARESPNDALVRAASLGSRVDAAHARAGESEPADVAVQVSPPEVVRPAAPSLTATVQQVRTQATQLAVHLQRQQVAVDHREAELNARMAEMESQVRSARLWLTERHLEIARQKSELERRESELSQREARPSEPSPADRSTRSESSFSGPVSTFDTEETARRETELAAREAELERRQRELDEMTKRLADRLAAAQRAGDAEQSLRAVKARQESLERAERLLASDHSECELLRRQLMQERERFAEHVQAERQALDDERRRAMSENEKVRHDLARQTDELASRQAALERMRADVARGQQEALEIRLATEELWSRLCGSMAPAALTQSLAQIRLKLAEEQRLARAEIAQQTHELHAPAARVGEQHKKLCDERQELQSWASSRQQQIEKQAGLLVTQEQQIEEERTKFQQARTEWQSERFRLQQEIRRMLRQSDLRAAAAA